MKKILMVLGLWSLVSVGFADVGTVSINTAGDTALVAKNSAMISARRQIIIDVLSKYADGISVVKSVADTDDNELMDLVETTSISDERQSNTDYFATFEMKINMDKAREFLEKNGIQHKIGQQNIVGNRVMLSLPITDVNDWIRVARNMYDNGTIKDFELQSVSKNHIMATMPYGKQMSAL